MRLNSLFYMFGILCLISVSVNGEELCGVTESRENYTDTIPVYKRGNYLYFSRSVLGIKHIHFLRKGMKCICPDSFVQGTVNVDPKMVLSCIHGMHVIPEQESHLEINNIRWNAPPPIQPDTAIYHVDAVIFDSYFEDLEVESDPEKNILIVHKVISFVPKGYMRYEVVYIGKQPFIIRKANVDGVLYTEWFSFGSCRQSIFYTTTKYIGNGIGMGIREAARGIGLGGSHAAIGFLIGGSHAVRGTGIGLESATSGIGRAVFDESKMFYQPGRELDDMGEFMYDEKTINVEEGITIYTYFFKSKSPKANIFLIHGNGGNVSTYKKMICVLLSGQYNVYVVDWRGYGKSTGRPDYKGVLKDTGAAFDDFLSLIQDDSLKVIVYGMSLGGQIATKLVSDRQDEVDGLILDGSLSSAQNLAMDFMPGKFIRNSMKRNSSLFNQEYIAERDIQTILNIPKLIIHSLSDQIVSFYHGEKLYKNAQEPKFFWKTNTRHIRTLEELPEETLEWIDQLIGYDGTK